MRIVVCVKHVPDVLSERALENGRITRGEDDVLNELDENAIEAAVQIAEEAGDDAEVIALTVGPEEADDALRRALTMGAACAYHVCDERAAGSDLIGTARVLGAAITHIAAERGQVDLVITGMSATDSMTSMLPSALAAVLHLPALTLAHRIEVKEVGASRTVTIDKIEGTTTSTLRAPLPALVSVTDQANEPRYPNFKALMAAKKKPVFEVDLDDLNLGEYAAMVGDEGAGARVIEAHAQPAREAGQIIQDTGDAGTRLADYIRSVIA